MLKFSNLSLMLITTLLYSSMSFAVDDITFQEQTVASALPHIQHVLQTQNPSANAAARTRLMSAQVNVDSALHFVKQNYNPRTHKTHRQYQQYHHGIPVVGARIHTHIRGNAASDATLGATALAQQPSTAMLSGRMSSGIHITSEDIARYNDSAHLTTAMNQAVATFTENHPGDWQIEPLSPQTKILVVKREGKLVHHIRFYAKSKHAKKKQLINMYVDAADPRITYQTWNNLQYYANTAVTGFGGNSKTTRYTYGKNNIPKLNIRRTLSSCIMENDRIRVVNALDKPDDDAYQSAYRYRCNDTVRDKYVYCTANPSWFDSEDDADDVEDADDNEADDDNRSDEDPRWHQSNPARMPNMDDSQTANLIQSNLTLTSSARSFDDYPFDGNKWCFTAFSPANDALFYGQLVDDMYKDWYQATVFPEQLRLKVHVGTLIEDGVVTDSMANAYWDPELRTLNFGDGFKEMMYPLVTVDIVAHELSHAFTTDHTDLTYLAQTGSLNEAYSDMAGAAATAYLMEKYPTLYLNTYHQADMMWTIGPTVFVTPWDGAYSLLQLGSLTDTERSMIGEWDNMAYSFGIRYMNQPSHDNLSADCFDPVAGCDISYYQLEDKITELAKQYAPFVCPTGELTEDCLNDFLQEYVVHFGSGVFNKAFYALATKPDWSVEKAFEVMLTANQDGYWVDNPNAGNQANYFNEAACGTLAATEDLGYAVNDVRDAFQQVGLLLDTSTPCAAA